MGGQCCSGDQKHTTDGMSLGTQQQTQQPRRMESTTGPAKGHQEDMLKASFQTDDHFLGKERSDTFASYGRTSIRSGSIASVNLSIEIPPDTTSDRNPNFKTPVDYNPPSAQTVLEQQNEDDDAVSEKMVMQQSDSTSSLGSQMIRMDSNQQLSSMSSLSNIHDMNKASQAKLAAAGSTTQFVNIGEEDQESDDESMMERMDAESDATSAMIRVDESETTSVVRDEATSQSQSVMERVDDLPDQLVNNKDLSSVPKELRTLGRAQVSAANLGLSSIDDNKTLGRTQASAANLGIVPP